MTLYHLLYRLSLGRFASLRFYFNRYSAIASQFYFCTSSARIHGFILLLLPSVITHCSFVFVAVGRTAKDVTYRSYFDETFVGGIN